MSDGEVLLREIEVRPTPGGRLAALRQRAGLSQAELARRMKRTQTAISYWEDDKRRPSFDDLCSLADMFGATLDWIVRGEGPVSRDG